MAVTLPEPGVTELKRVKKPEPGFNPSNDFALSLFSIIAGLVGQSCKSSTAFK
jgi:hypothetical protein